MFAHPLVVLCYIAIIPKLALYICADFPFLFSFFFFFVEFLCKSKNTAASSNHYFFYLAAKQINSSTVKLT